MTSDLKKFPLAELVPRQYPPPFPVDGESYRGFSEHFPEEEYMSWFGRTDIFTQWGLSRSLEKLSSKRGTDLSTRQAIGIWACQPRNL